jgi:mRNA-degrading endonuclease toxin of MazEF toxin-antitoxin module
LSHDAFNQTPRWKSIIVVPLSTSSAQAARGATVVDIPLGIAGIRQDSVAVCHQVTTLDRAKLSRRIGLLPPYWLLAVEEALKAAMDLP